DQRYRNGDDGNDRRSPCLQEQDDDQNDEDDGLADRLLDGVDRLLDELGRIVDDVVFQTGRKTLRQLIHRLLDVGCSRQRIRAGPLEDTDRNGRITVEVRIRR